MNSPPLDFGVTVSPFPSATSNAHSSLSIHFVAASPGVIKVVETVKANPTQLGCESSHRFFRFIPTYSLSLLFSDVTVFMVNCFKKQHTGPASKQDARQSPVSPMFPTSPTLSDAETPYSTLSVDSDAHTVVSPHLVSNYEKHFYYHGVSGDPPQLLYRSDLETNPFPIPPPGTRFSKIPSKTANGIFGTPLNLIWDDQIVPQIFTVMKSNDIKCSALTTARFTTVADGNVTTGPDVVWIAVRPNTTKAEALRDVTPDILQIFTDSQITGIVVEWYEGEVSKLAGPALMSVVNRTHPTFGLNHPFNTGLGIPIARQSDDAQGTLTLLFKEVKTKDGKPSDRVLGVTNKHVACEVTTEDYQYDGTNPQYILVCGDCRLQRAMAEIKTAVSTGLRDAIKLIGEVADLESKVGTAEEDSRALRLTKSELEQRHEDNGLLETFFDQVNADWQNGDERRFGIVDWAPKISVGVDDRNYTRDIATFVIDETKLKNFVKNVVDLGALPFFSPFLPSTFPHSQSRLLTHRFSGNKFTAGGLEDLFWPIDATRKGRTIPANLQLPIPRALPRRRVLNPDTEDKNGEPLYIVGKYGNTTNLTLGRYSGMDGYTCDEFGIESREVVVYNYTKAEGRKTSGDFSDHGDSGSLIFTGDGDGLAVLHSGMSRGFHNHVTYGTPLWWAIQQIKVQYPYAEFYEITYSFD